MNRITASFPLAAFLFLAAAPPLAHAQASVPVEPPAEMAALDFLIGDWEGEGWVQQGPSGERTEFESTESVHPELDGYALLVKGRHTAEIPGQGVVPVHRALGIFSWNEAAGEYQFNTYVAGQGGQIATGRFVEGDFVWGFDVQQGQIRFTISSPEEGVWKEVGEFSPDGQTWHPFLEMNLTRVDQ